MKLLNIAREAAIEAGKQIMKIYDSKLLEFLHDLSKLKDQFIFINLQNVNYNFYILKLLKKEHVLLMIMEHI